MLKYPELIVFDLDGTLVDSAPDLAYAVDETLREFDLPEVGEQRVRGWIGNGVNMLVQRAMSGEMHPAEEPPLFADAFQRFQQIYEDNLCDRGRFYPGVIEGLGQLRESEFKLACITNKHSRFTLPLLERTELAGYFDFIVCGDSFEERKPHPLPLLKTATHFDAEPSDSIMVGDSINDIQAARAADFQAIGVPYGYHNGKTMEELAPDAVVESISELPKLFEIVA